MPTDNTQPYVHAKPKFKIGELVFLGDCLCRIMGMERYYPADFWIYSLGEQIGERKFVYHQAVTEYDLKRPDKKNIVEMRRK